MSYLEQAFKRYWNKNFNPSPVPEFSFHPVRKWRFDFAWPDKKIALEIQGHGPGHTSKKGMTQDADKNNTAILLGWKVVYFTSYHLHPTRIRASCTLLSSILGVPQNVTPSERRPRTYIGTAYRKRRK